MEALPRQKLQSCRLKVTTSVRSLGPSEVKNSKVDDLATTKMI